MLGGKSANLVGDSEIFSNVIARRLDKCVPSATAAKGPANAAAEVARSSGNRGVLSICLADLWLSRGLATLNKETWCERTRHTELWGRRHEARSGGPWESHICGDCGFKRPGPPDPLGTRDIGFHAELYAGRTKSRANPSLDPALIQVTTPMVRGSGTGLLSLFGLKSLQHHRKMLDRSKKKFIAPGRSSTASRREHSRSHSKERQSATWSWSPSTT